MWPLITQLAILSKSIYNIMYLNRENGLLNVHIVTAVGRLKISARGVADIVNFAYESIYTQNKSISCCSVCIIIDLTITYEM